MTHYALRNGADKNAPQGRGSFYQGYYEVWVVARLLMVGLIVENLQKIEVCILTEATAPIMWIWPTPRRDAMIDLVRVPPPTYL